MTHRYSEVEDVLREAFRDQEHAVRGLRDGLIPGARRLRRIQWRRRAGLAGTAVVTAALVIGVAVATGLPHWGDDRTGAAPPSGLTRPPGQAPPLPHDWVWYSSLGLQVRGARWLGRQRLRLPHDRRPDGGAGNRVGAGLPHPGGGDEAGGHHRGRPRPGVRLRFPGPFRDRRRRHRHPQRGGAARRPARRWAGHPVPGRLPGRAACGTNPS